MGFLEMNVTVSALILMSSMISQMFKERNLIQPDDYLLIFCGAPVHTVGGEGGGVNAGKFKRVKCTKV